MLKARATGIFLAVVVLFAAAGEAGAQERSKRGRRQVEQTAKPQEPRRFRVSGGVISETSEAGIRAADSVANVKAVAALRARADSLSRSVDSLKLTAMEIDSADVAREALLHRADSLETERLRILAEIPQAVATDSLKTAATDSSAVDSLLTDRERRRLERREEGRYSLFFRDTMPISRMTALSFALPGFGQLHNKQYWKMPLLYGTVGAALYSGMQQNNCYQKAKSHYDDLIRFGYTRENSDMDQTQRVMLKYNTRRQLLYGAAAAAYVYFIGDAVMNHPGNNQNVKLATTLSTICPGAGQFYNRSYWKAPIVAGVFATMVMTVDWNNRAYERYKTAYDLKTTGRNDEVERWLSSASPQALKANRDNARRNRDLCIILTGLAYLVNIMDAHVDAHMKTYDVSDDLNIALVPTVGGFSTSRGSGAAFGMSMNLRF